MADALKPRPKWSVKTMNEEDARWFYNNYVVSVELKREFYDCDKSRNWLEFKAQNGKVKTLGYFPSCLEFQPSHFVRLIHLERSVVDEILMLDEWDKQNAKDIAEFKRLKRKLYGND